MKAIPMLNRKFGRLTVIGRADTRRKALCWRCVCDCGSTVVRYGSWLRASKAPHCGCAFHVRHCPGRGCSVCRQKNREALRRLRREAVARSMCNSCRCRPVVDGFRYCDLHINGARRRRLRANPWCDDCFMAGGHRMDCAANRRTA